MSDEERAHDIAIEIMKMYFSENKDSLTDGEHSDNAIKINELIQVYKGAYEHIKEII